MFIKTLGAFVYLSLKFTFKSKRRQKQGKESKKKMESQYVQQTELAEIPLFERLSLTIFDNGHLIVRS